LLIVAAGAGDAEYLRGSLGALQHNLIHPQGVGHLRVSHVRKDTIEPCL
jgi:hypothetical protein